jgi:hypothetical protein
MEGMGWMRQTEIAHDFKAGRGSCHRRGGGFSRVPRFFDLGPLLACPQPTTFIVLGHVHLRIRGPLDITSDTSCLVKLRFNLPRKLSTHRSVKSSKSCSMRANNSWMLGEPRRNPTAFPFHVSSACKLRIGFSLLLGSNQCFVAVKAAQQSRSPRS